MLVNGNQERGQVQVLYGRMLEKSKKQANPIMKGLSALGFLFTCLYYFVAIGLCATIIGAIVGIPLFIGAAAFQSALLSVMVDGTKYRIECPICQRTIENVFKPKKEPEQSLKCPSCKNIIIVRDDIVLSYR